MSFKLKISYRWASKVFSRFIVALLSLLILQTVSHAQISQGPWLNPHGGLEVADPSLQMGKPYAQMGLSRVAPPKSGSKSSREYNYENLDAFLDYYLKQEGHWKDIFIPIPEEKEVVRETEVAKVLYGVSQRFFRPGNENLLKELEHNTGRVFFSPYDFALMDVIVGLYERWLIENTPAEFLDNLRDELINKRNHQPTTDYGKFSKQQIRRMARDEREYRHDMEVEDAMKKLPGFIIRKAVGDARSCLENMDFATTTILKISPIDTGIEKIKERLIESNSSDADFVGQVAQIKTVEGLSGFLPNLTTSEVIWAGLAKEVPRELCKTGSGNFYSQLFVSGDGIYYTDGSSVTSEGYGKPVECDRRVNGEIDRVSEGILPQVVFYRNKFSTILLAENYPPYCNLGLSEELSRIDLSNLSITDEFIDLKGDYGDYYGENHVLTGAGIKEVTKLLARVPSVFYAKRGFRGYIVPIRGGITFVYSDGGVAEFVPYNKNLKGSSQNVGRSLIEKIDPKRLAGFRKTIRRYIVHSLRSSIQKMIEHTPDDSPYLSEVEKQARRLKAANVHVSTVPTNKTSKLDFQLGPEDLERRPSLAELMEKAKASPAGGYVTLPSQGVPEPASSSGSKGGGPPRAKNKFSRSSGSIGGIILGAEFVSHERTADHRNPSGGLLGFPEMGGQARGARHYRAGKPLGWPGQYGSLETDDPFLDNLSSQEQKPYAQMGYSRDGVPGTEGIDWPSIVKQIRGQYDDLPFAIKIGTDGEVKNVYVGKASLTANVLRESRGDYFLIRGAAFAEFSIDGEVWKHPDIYRYRDGTKVVNYGLFEGIDENHLRPIFIFDRRHETVQCSQEPMLRDSYSNATTVDPETGKPRMPEGIYEYLSEVYRPEELVKILQKEIWYDLYYLRKELDWVTRQQLFLPELTEQSKKVFGWNQDLREWAITDLELKHGLDARFTKWVDAENFGGESLVTRSIESSELRNFNNWVFATGSDFLRVTLAKIQWNNRKAMFENPGDLAEEPVFKEGESVGGVIKLFHRGKLTKMPISRLRTILDLQFEIFEDYSRVRINRQPEVNQQLGPVDRAPGVGSTLLKKLQLYMKIEKGLRVEVGLINTNLVTYSDGKHGWFTQADLDLEGKSIQVGLPEKVDTPELLDALLQRGVRLFVIDGLVGSTFFGEAFLALLRDKVGVMPGTEDKPVKEFDEAINAFSEKLTLELLDGGVDLRTLKSVLKIRTRKWVEEQADALRREAELKSSGNHRKQGSKSKRGKFGFTVNAGQDLLTGISDRPGSRTKNHRNPAGGLSGFPEMGGPTRGARHYDPTLPPSESTGGNIASLAELPDIRELAGFISLERGIEMVKEKAIALHSGDQDAVEGLRKAKTVSDLNRYLPDLTSYEVMFISLLKEAPDCMCRNESKSFMMQFGFDATGVKYLDDTSAPEDVSDIAGEPFRENFEKALNDKIYRSVSDALYYLELMALNLQSAHHRGIKLLRKASHRRPRPKDYIATGDYSEARNLVARYSLLERLPKIVQGELDLFYYVFPYAEGLAFISSDGKQVDFVRYSKDLNFPKRRTIRSFEDIPSEVFGRTSMEIYDAVAKQLVLKMESYADILIETSDPSKLSLMEQIAQRLRKNLGINIGTGSKSQGMDDDLSPLHKKKPSLEEVRQYAKLLEEVLPYEIASRVRSIRKSFRYYYQKSGGRTYALWDTDLKKLVVYSYKDRSFRAFVDVEKTYYLLSLIHEIAHGIWFSLEPPQRGKYVKGWWHKGRPVDPEGGCLSKYSEVDPVEHFADHFAFYVLNGTDFKAGVEKSESQMLRASYDFIKEYLLGVVQRNAGGKLGMLNKNGEFLNRKGKQISRFSIAELNDFGAAGKAFDALNLLRLLSEVRPGKRAKEEDGQDAGRKNEGKPPAKGGADNRGDPPDGSRHYRRTNPAGGSGLLYGGGDKHPSGRSKDHHNPAGGNVFNEFGGITPGARHYRSKVGSSDPAGGGMYEERGAASKPTLFERLGLGKKPSGVSEKFLEDELWQIVKENPANAWYLVSHTLSHLGKLVQLKTSDRDYSPASWGSFTPEQRQDIILSYREAIDELIEKKGGFHPVARVSEEGKMNFYGFSFAEYQVIHSFLKQHFGVSAEIHNIKDSERSNTSYFRSEGREGDLILHIASEYIPNRGDVFEQVYNTLFVKNLQILLPGETFAKLAQNFNIQNGKVEQLVIFIETQLGLEVREDWLKKVRDLSWEKLESSLEEIYDKLACTVGRNSKLINNIADDVETMSNNRALRSGSEEIRLKRGRKIIGYLKENLEVEVVEASLMPSGVYYDKSESKLKVYLSADNARNSKVVYLDTSPLSSEEGRVVRTPLLGYFYDILFIFSIRNILEARAFQTLIDPFATEKVELIDIGQVVTTLEDKEGQALREKWTETLINRTSIEVLDEALEKVKDEVSDFVQRQAEGLEHAVNNLKNSQKERGASQAENPRIGRTKLFQLAAYMKGLGTEFVVLESPGKDVRDATFMHSGGSFMYLIWTGKSKMPSAPRVFEQCFDWLLVEAAMEVFGKEPVGEIYGAFNNTQRAGIAPIARMLEAGIDKGILDDWMRRISKARDAGIWNEFNGVLEEMKQSLNGAKGMKGIEITAEWLSHTYDGPRQMRRKFPVRLIAGGGKGRSRVKPDGAEGRSYRSPRPEGGSASLLEGGGNGHPSGGRTKNHRNPAGGLLGFPEMGGQARGARHFSFAPNSPDGSAGWRVYEGGGADAAASEGMTLFQKLGLEQPSDVSEEFLEDALWEKIEANPTAVWNLQLHTLKELGDVVVSNTKDKDYKPISWESFSWGQVENELLGLLLSVQQDLDKISSATPAEEDVWSSTLQEYGKFAGAMESELKDEEELILPYRKVIEEVIERRAGEFHPLARVSKKGEMNFCGFSFAEYQTIQNFLQKELWINSAINKLESPEKSNAVYVGDPEGGALIFLNIATGYVPNQGDVFEQVYNAAFIKALESLLPNETFGKLAQAFNIQDGSVEQMVIFVEEQLGLAMREEWLKKISKMGWERLEGALTDMYNQMESRIREKINLISNIVNNVKEINSEKVVNTGIEKIGSKRGKRVISYLQENFEVEFPQSTDQAVYYDKNRGTFIAPLEMAAVTDIRDASLVREEGAIIGTPLLSRVYDILFVANVKEVLGAEAFQILIDPFSTKDTELINIEPIVKVFEGQDGRALRECVEVQLNGTGTEGLNEELDKVGNEVRDAVRGQHEELADTVNNLKNLQEKRRASKTTNPRIGSAKLPQLTGYMKERGANLVSFKGKKSVSATFMHSDGAFMYLIWDGERKMPSAPRVFEQCFDWLLVEAAMEVFGKEPIREIYGALNNRQRVGISPVARMLEADIDKGILNDWMKRISKAEAEKIENAFNGVFEEMKQHVSAVKNIETTAERLSYTHEGPRQIRRRFLIKRSGNGISGRSKAKPGSAGGRHYSKFRPEGGRVLLEGGGNSDPRGYGERHYRAEPIYEVGGAVRGVNLGEDTQAKHGNAGKGLKVVEGTQAQQSAQSRSVLTRDELSRAADLMSEAKARGVDKIMKRPEKLHRPTAIGNMAKGYGNILVGEVGSEIFWGLADKDYDSLKEVLDHMLTLEKAVSFNALAMIHSAETKAIHKILPAYSKVDSKLVKAAPIVGTAIPQKYLMTRYFAQHGIALASAMYLSGIIGTALFQGGLQVALDQHWNTQAAAHTGVIAGGFLVGRMPFTAFNMWRLSKKAPNLYKGYSTLRKIRAGLQLVEGLGSASLKGIAVEVGVFILAEGVDRIFLPMVDELFAKSKLTKARKNVEKVLSQKYVRESEIEEVLSEFWGAMQQYQQSVIMPKYFTKYYKAMEHRSKLNDSGLVAEDMTRDPLFEEVAKATFASAAERAIFEDDLVERLTIGTRWLYEADHLWNWLCDKHAHLCPDDEYPHRSSQKHLPLGEVTQESQVTLDELEEGGIYPLEGDCPMEFHRSLPQVDVHIPFRFDNEIHIHDGLNIDVPVTIPERGERFNNFLWCHIKTRLEKADAISYKDVKKHYIPHLGYSPRERKESDSKYEKAIAKGEIPEPSTLYEQELNALFYLDKWYGLAVEQYEGAEQTKHGGNTCAMDTIEAYIEKGIKALHMSRERARKAFEEGDKNLPDIL